MSYVLILDTKRQEDYLAKQFSDFKRLKEYGGGC